MQLETVLCKFEQICTTRNALMLLETILCEIGQICAIASAVMLLETILCEFERICMTGNALTLLETILCGIGQICAIVSALMLLETILCKFGQICAKGNAFVVLHCWQELHFEISRQKLNRNVPSPSILVMTHHTAKANLEKGSSWPPEAIPYGAIHTRGLVLTQPISPTPWTRPSRSQSSDSPLPSDY